MPLSMRVVLFEASRMGRCCSCCVRPEVEAVLRAFMGLEARGAELQGLQARTRATFGSRSGPPARAYRFHGGARDQLGRSPSFPLRHAHRRCPPLTNSFGL